MAMFQLNAEPAKEDSVHKEISDFFMLCFEPNRQFCPFLSLVYLQPLEENRTGLQSNVYLLKRNVTKAPYAVLKMCVYIPSFQKGRWIKLLQQKQGSYLKAP